MKAFKRLRESIAADETLDDEGKKCITAFVDIAEDICTSLRRIADAAAEGKKVPDAVQKSD